MPIEIGGTAYDTNREDRVLASMGAGGLLAGYLGSTSGAAGLAGLGGVGTSALAWALPGAAVAGGAYLAYEALADALHDTHQDRGERKVYGGSNQSFSGEEYLEKPSEGKYQLYGKWDEAEARAFAKEQGWGDDLTFHKGNRDSYFTYTRGGGGGGIFEEDRSLSMADILGAAEAQFQQNLANLPSYMNQIVGPALSQTKRIDAFLSERDRRTLQEAYGADYDTIVSELVGGRRGLLDDLTGITQDLLAGEIPQDVQDLIVRTRAEMGESQGLFGQAANYATARDLGRTSLDMMNLGAQYTTNTISPLTQSLLTTARALQPPMADPGAMISLGASLAGRPMSATESAQLRAGTDQFNREMAWAQDLSGLNYDLQMQQLQAQQNYMDQMLKQQQQQAFWNTVGTIGGIATGLPWNSILGGSQKATAPAAISPAAISPAVSRYAAISPLDADPTGGGYWSSYDDYSQAGMSYNPWLYSTSSPADGNYFSTYYE